jgi:hypothetical protein
MGEAQFLGALRELPRVARSGDADPEIHVRFPLSYSGADSAPSRNRSSLGPT